MPDGVNRLDEIFEYVEAPKTIKHVIIYKFCSWFT